MLCGRNWILAVVLDSLTKDHCCGKLAGEMGLRNLNQFL